MTKKELLALIEGQKREIDGLKARVATLEGARIIDAIGKNPVVPWIPENPDKGSGYWPPQITWLSSIMSDPDYDYYELVNTSGDRIIGRNPKLPEGTIQVFGTC
jgi:hypothetical protein